jgi:hypothetical protein
MILYCTCSHKFQDERYGASKRVHNPTKQSPPQYRCTVCNRVKSKEGASKPQ